MNKTMILAAALLLTMLAPHAASAAAFGSCNAVATNENFDCRAGLAAWFCFDTTATMVPEIQAWAAEEGNYQTTVPCVQSEVIDRGVLVMAGVDEGGCTAGQIGTEVANPQTLNQFSYFFLRNILRDRYVTWRDGENVAAAVAGVTPTPDPVFGDGEAP